MLSLGGSVSLRSLVPHGTMYRTGSTRVRWALHGRAFEQKTVGEKIGGAGVFAMLAWECPIKQMPTVDIQVTYDLNGERINNGRASFSVRFKDLDVARDYFDRCVRLIEASHRDGKRLKLDAFDDLYNQNF
jgi:hypothetical protein